MPARLRPTAPIAPDAILVGDPGRALLLAQALLEQPKMSNHARGLWGYSGRTPAGRELTLQSTGMGGPSAAVVLADLAELGVRRAVRIGSCAALGPGVGLGELVVVAEAHLWPAPGGGESRAILPDPALREGLEVALGERARPGVAVSLDSLHRPGAGPPPPLGDVADMQTAALLGAGEGLGVALAAVLIVAETAGEASLDDEAMERAATLAGTAAAAALL